MKPPTMLGYEIGLAVAGVVICFGPWAVGKHPYWDGLLFSAGVLIVLGVQGIYVLGKRHGRTSSSSGQSDG